MASILLVVKHWEQEQAAIEKMRQIAFETSTTPVAGDKIHRTTAGGDSRKLRGLPAIARLVSGAIPDTTPGTDGHLDSIQ